MQVIQINLIHRSSYACVMNFVVLHINAYNIICKYKYIISHRGRAVVKNDGEMTEMSFVVATENGNLKSRNAHGNMEIYILR